MEQEATTTQTTQKDAAESGDYYFQSYSHFSIHEEMLKDEVRTGTYRRAIVENGEYFKDKVVLDVGCGTGILSMFAAQAGAKMVIGIDCSEIVTQAREIIRVNGFADKITLIKGKVEEVELPVDKVDIIVSEWMGYFLVYENMLETVLYARDKWLKPDGHILPDKARLFFCAIEDADYKQEKIGWWSDVYGFNMSCITEVAMQEPLIDVVESHAVVSTSSKVVEIDIKTIGKDELTFASPFHLTFQRNDLVHAFVAYFDVQFNMPRGCLGFSTGPKDRYTHWKQTVFYLEDTLSVYKGEELDGEFSCKPNAKNPREMDIVLSYTHKGGAGQFQPVKKTQQYFLR
eukprot:TRINITY_DN2410_c0_g1_i1.p1 TRINITY_DN2410_c0_g1~~TRINITY_DN2410_c0_g1_i1.p1  ORF type:complete len:344 (-),score=82.29 TRINITY_DN2410_c0_g1_i1:95-1126(-)